MANFGPEIFKRLANEVNFRKVPRKNGAGRKWININRDLRKAGVDVFPATSMSGSTITHLDDCHNFKEAVFSILMMRAARLVKTGDTSVEVNLKVTFRERSGGGGSVHPEAKGIDKVAGTNLIDRKGASGIDTVITDEVTGASNPEEYNMISLLSLEQIALACGD